MKKTKIHFAIVILLIIAVVGINCSKSTADSSNVQNTCDPNISFANTIKPILDHNCNFAGCHDDQVITALNIFQTVHDGAAQIKLSILTGKMPRNRTMTAADKNAIYCWVDNGAKNN